MQTTVIAPQGTIDHLVKNIIVEKIGHEGSEIKDHAAFKDDLGIDSLDFCEILMEVEKRFGVHIPDEEAEKMRTVGSLISFVEKNN